MELTLNHLDKTRLIEMTIQSAPCEHIQESGELKSVARDVGIARSLKAKGWSVAYTFEIETMMHRLGFVVDERGKEKARKMQMEEKELVEQGEGHGEGSLSQTPINASAPALCV